METWNKINTMAQQYDAIKNSEAIFPVLNSWNNIHSIYLMLGATLLTGVVSSPRTYAPCPPWTSWWSAWSSWSSSPWRPGSTHCLPASPFCPRSETRLYAGAGRCLATGPGCKGGCSSEPVWGFGTDAPPAEREDVRGKMRCSMRQEAGAKKKKKKKQDRGCFKKRLKQNERQRKTAAMHFHYVHH